MAPATPMPASTCNSSKRPRVIRNLPSDPQGIRESFPQAINHDRQDGGVAGGPGESKTAQKTLPAAAPRFGNGFDHVQYSLVNGAQPPQAGHERQQQASLQSPLQ